MYFALVFLMEGLWFLAACVAFISLLLGGATARLVFDGNDGVIDTLFGCVACITVMLAGPVCVFPAALIIALIAGIIASFWAGYKITDRILAR